MNEAKKLLAEEEERRKFRRRRKGRIRELEEMRAELAVKVNCSNCKNLNFMVATSSNPFGRLP